MEFTDELKQINKLKAILNLISIARQRVNKAEESYLRHKVSTDFSLTPEKDFTKSIEKAQAVHKRLINYYLKKKGQLCD
jgi:hypothetical protein